MKNYYKILEVDENASPEIIEKAYKTLAKKYHPDSQGYKNSYLSESNFKQISEAYYTLSDIEKRKQHDLALGISSVSNFYPNRDDFNTTINQANTSNELNESNNNAPKFTYTGLLNNSFKNLSSLVKDEFNVPKSERKNLLLAIGLTAASVSILIGVILLVPALKNYFFPFLT